MEPTSDLIDALPLGICAVDDDGRLVFANARLGQLACAAPDALVGEPLTELLRTVPAHGCGARPYRTWLRPASGQPLGVVVLPAPRAGGGTTLAVVAEETLHAGLLSQVLEQVRRAEQLADRIERVVGDVASSRPPPRVPRGQTARDSDDPPMLELLSQREREIVRALLEARPVRDIAAALKISPHTVRNHLKSSFRKLNVGSQVELVTKLTSQAPLPPPPPVPAGVE